MAARLGVPLLGRLPIDPEIAALCDRGPDRELSGRRLPADRGATRGTGPGGRPAGDAGHMNGRVLVAVRW